MQNAEPADPQAALIAQLQWLCEAQGHDLHSLGEGDEDASDTAQTSNLFTVGIELAKTLGAYVMKMFSRLFRKPRVRTLPAAEFERERWEDEDGSSGAQERPQAARESVLSRLGASSGLASAERAPPRAAALPAQYIDWLEVCESELEPLPTVAPAPAVAEAEPAAWRYAAASHDAACADGDAASTLPAGIGALMAQVPGLEDLLASLGIAPAPAIERPADWSYRWAWQAIKRRIARLNDSSIAWLLSNVDEALAFLRELADLATPPKALEGA